MQMTRILENMGWISWQVRKLNLPHRWGAAHRYCYFYIDMNTVKIVHLQNHVG